MTEHNDNPITQPEQPASPQAPAQQQASAQPADRTQGPAAASQVPPAQPQDAPGASQVPPAQPEQPYAQAQQQQPYAQPTYAQPVYPPAPLMKLSGGMKFAWFVIGALVGIPGILLAWVCNADKYPQVEKRRREILRYRLRRVDACRHHLHHDDRRHARRVRGRLRSRILRHLRWNLVTSGFMVQGGFGRHARQSPYEPSLGVIVATAKHVLR